MTDAIRRRAQSVVNDFTDEGKKQEGQSASAAEASVARCLVYCRLRPSTPKDYEDGAFQLVSMDKKRVIVKDERHYDFDGTFDQSCRQDDIFQQVAMPCINHAFNGFCSALMCYGQTGTGKSFTMCCTKPGAEGVIPRAAQFIFEKIANDPSRVYNVTAQFIQIYRDQLGDLMSDTGREKVDIRFEASEGVSLPGCSQHSIRSDEEFMNFYNDGNKRRVVTATAMNPESSRGHSALVVWVQSEPADDPCGSKLKGKITFIDLAGYERFSKTGISNSNSIMKDEAKTINASLLSLGHVVSSLSNGDKHIPWRNSKLTRLLQDSIGGRSRTSIILTIGPSSDHLHETSNSLQFGLRAMAVKVEAKVSVSVDYEKLAAKLQMLLDEKNQRISVLELQIASRDADREELLDRHLRDGTSLQERHQEELKQLVASGASTEQIQKLQEVYEVEMQNLKEQQREEFSYQEEQHNKEIVNLVSEQQKNETRRTTEMQLVQERLIEEFQSKLDAARGGEMNEDLASAFQQLAQKDAVIAARANNTARLLEHVEALTQQLKEKGLTPVKEASLPETFLDISQVEEIQSKLQQEIERQHLKIVDLRAQLDKLSFTCNERLEEVQEVQAENERLRQELTKAGVTAEATLVEMERLERHKAKLVDPAELETLRVMMQADIDELRSQNDSLQADIFRLKEQQTVIPLTARARGMSLMNRNGPPRPSAAGGDSAMARSEAAAHYKEQVQTLQESILRGDQERNTLCQRIAELENKLEENGIEVDPDDVFDAPKNSDIELLIRTKDTELDALLQLVGRQEHQLSSERHRREQLEKTNRLLLEKLEAAGIAVDDEAIHSSSNLLASSDGSAAAIPIETYMELLRKMRDTSTAVAKRLLVRSFEEAPEAAEEDLVRDKDEELQLKDELILAKATECKALIKIAGTLERQLDEIGLDPACRLSNDHRLVLNEDEEEKHELIEKQQTLEEDRKKLQSVLESLNADRAAQAAVFANRQKKLEHDLEEHKRELEAQRNAQREKEQILEEQTRLATRQMMDAQARMAASEGSGGVLGRFKKLFN